MAQFTTFEVYTYFGRVISRHTCDHSKELHHRALNEARERARLYAGASWIRQVNGR